MNTTTRAHLAAILALAAAGCSRSAPPAARQAQPIFANGGFEDAGGSLGSWTTTVYWNNGITYPPQSYADLKLRSCSGYTPGGIPDCTNRTSAKVDAVPESQQMTGLSGLASPRWPKFGTASAVVNEQGLHQNVNSLKQRYTTTAADVDPADGKIHARFALSPQLQDPGHNPDQQPYFFVILRNVTKGTTLYQTFNYSNQAGIPWQTFTPPATGATPVRYTDWQLFDIAPGNAALAIGDTVEMEVVAAGCSPNGHWGQVFVDGFGAMLPSLSISKSAPQWALADADLTYAFQVENATAFVARNAIANEVLPANTAFMSVSAPAGVTCTAPAVGTAGTGLAGGPTVSCNLGWMNPYSSQTFQVTVHTAAGLANNTVITNGNYWVQGDGINPILGPAVQTTIGNGPYADLAISVTDGVPAVVWGGSLTYLVTATNYGPTTVTNATVNDTFPAQVTVGSWTCAATGGGSCGTASGSGNVTNANGKVTLPPLATATFTVPATVVAGSGNGTLTNTATIATPGGVTESNPGNNTDADVDSIGTIYSLTVTKDLAETGRGQVVSSPTGISCGSTCASQSTSFLDGSQVTLTAIARPGDTFVGWDGGCSGTANVCTVAVSGGPVAVAAHFRGPIVSGSAPDGHGTVTCPSSPVVQQSSATCTFAPAPGYELAALTDNGADVFASASGNALVISGAALVNDQTVVATFLLSNGGTCGADGECARGHCADGVCCDGACTGQCEACNLAGHVGVCTPVTGAPRGGRPACAGDGSACSGACDGTATSACTYPGTSVFCRTATCANGTASGPASCDGAGHCPAGAGEACGAYVCGPTACLTSCSADGQCAAGDYCQGGACVPQRIAGQACTAAGQCLGGHCVDGVCCDSACDGQCEACDVSGHAGTCTAVIGAPAAPRPACASDASACGGACDGARRNACAYPGEAVSCRAAACASGTATLAESCDGQGRCPAVQTQACTPFVCAGTACAGGCHSESDCAIGEWCSAGVCRSKLAAGVACGGDGQCATGHCVDGVCCDDACDGQCEACNLPGRAGTCAAASGAPLGGRAPCAGDGSSCSGTCDGAQRATCAYPRAPTSCRAPSCTGGVATLAAACDGAGHCPGLQTEACAPHVCGANACLGDCVADVQCAAGSYCAGGVCSPKLAQGAACAATGQCASGHCVDGFCCDRACSGQCEACGVVGAEGTCSPVTGAPVGARPGCAGDGSTCEGACDGGDGSACAYPGSAVECRPAACSGGVATLAAACDGAGSCPTVRHQTCAPWVCGATACAGDCSADPSSCPAGEFCAAGVCVARGGAGEVCGGDGQCASGHCVDGVCCDAACAGACEACDVPGHLGVCTAAIGAPHGARPACASDGSACGGACDGSSRTACAYPGASTACADAACSGGVHTGTAVCGGAGACLAPQQVVCDSATCDGTLCAAVCTADAQCAADHECRGGACVAKVGWRMVGGGCSASGVPAAPLALLLLLLVPLRRRPRRAPRGALAALALALASAPAAARAQSETAVDAERFEPLGGAHDLLAVPSARAAGHLEAGGILLADYGAKPLRLVPVAGGEAVDLLSSQTNLVLAGTLGLLDAFELSAALPFSVSGSGQPASSADPTLSTAIPGSGLGDLRLTPKVQLVGGRSGFALALLAPVTLPTASALYLGHDGVTISPRVALELGRLGGWRVAADAGAVLQSTHHFLSVDVGSAISFGLAAELPFAGGRASALATLTGEASGGASTRALEALAAVRIRGPAGLSFTLGGGPGLSGGYGTPQYRMVAAIALGPAPAAADDAEAAASPPPAAAPASASASVHASAPAKQADPAAVLALGPARVDRPQGAAPAPTAAPATGRAVLKKSRIALVEPVEFTHDRDVLLPQSLDVLRDVAAILRDHPEIARLRIEGHTDDDGSASHLLDLSQRRALAVRDFLVKSGVDAGRLEARGYGDTRPVTTNFSEADRSRNRRIELWIQGKGADAPRSR